MSEQQNEIWRALPHKKGYEISNTGLVRSKFKTIVGLPDKRGYLRVSLWTEKGCRKFSIHKLMAETFLGVRPDGHVVRHLDGDNSNNNISNIAYGTRAQNELDKAAHGTALQGIKHPKSKLTDNQVKKIRHAFDRDGSNFLVKSFAEKYNVSPATIRGIVLRKRWKHLP